MPTVIAALSDPALALIVAGATLLGSAVGGGTTGLVTLRAERRREDFARAQDVERREREARQVGRLVTEELDDGETKIAIAHAEGHYWARPHDSLSTAQWNENRGVLAGDLDNATWATVATAFAWFNRLNWIVLEAEIELGEDQVALFGRIPVGDVDDLETAWECATDAKRALAAALGISTAPDDEAPPAGER